MLEKLKQRVLQANLDVVKAGLVILTWGNVSARDFESNLIVIKPSGVPYDTLKPEDMVVVDLEGKMIEGHFKPSSDLLTHLELYKMHPELGGIVHMHSTYAVAFAQAGRSIPAYGTTHADYFYGAVPCTRALTKDEITNDYELNTGRVINETMTDPVAIPGILVNNHGPFAWGKTCEEAVYHAIVLEEIAKMAILTETINLDVKSVDQSLLDKHYYRKHGKNAYYGQKEKNK